MKRTRVSSRESQRLSQLESRLGSRTIRTILSGDSERLMRPERFANIQRGTAKLTEAEKERIGILSANAQRVEQLAKKGESLGNREFQTNRALRDWLQFGKGKDQERRKNRDEELKAIKGLRRLGYTGSLKGKGYVRKAAK